MNHAGEIRNLVSFVRPHVALITTIAPAHLEFFGSCEAIADAKSEIFEGLAPGGAALIPSDSPYAERLAARAAQIRVGRLVRFGSTGEAKLLSFMPDGNGMRVKADILGRAVDCLVGARRRAYRPQCGGGAGGGGAGGWRCAQRRGLRLHGAEGRGAVRSQRHSSDRRSYNANQLPWKPLALLGHAKGRKLAVLGDMLEMGEGGLALHAALAEPIAAAHADLVFASGPQMKALWDALPASRRGAYAEKFLPRWPQADIGREARRHRAGERSRWVAWMAVIVEALKGS